MTQVDPTALRKALTTYFNEGELRTLCFDLGINYEDLGGRGKAENAAELVTYAQRHNFLDKLAYFVQDARPHVKLKTTKSEISTRETDPQATPQPNTEIHIHGNVTGSAIGGGTVQADNIAGNSITIGNQDVPATSEAFAEQVEALQKLLKQAIKQSEFRDMRDAKTAVEDLQDVIEEIQSPQPRRRRLTRRLEDVAETLNLSAQVADSMGNVGAAVLKAAPIAAGLIKLAQMVF